MTRTDRPVGLRRRTWRVHAWLAIGLAVGVLTGCGGAEPTPAASPTSATAPADFARFDSWLSWKIPNTTAFPATAVLEGSNWNLRLSWAATVTSLPVEVAEQLDYEKKVEDGLELVPASGHEFLVVRVAPTNDYRTVPDQEKPQSFQVVVDGEARTLDMIPGTLGGHIVLSVPTGAETFLQVTADDQADRINLRTGTGAIKRPCTSHRRGTNSGTYTVVHGGEEYRVKISVTVEQAGRVEKRGWAAIGRCWLEVSVDTTVFDGSTTEVASIPGVDGYDPELRALSIDGAPASVDAAPWNVPDRPTNVTLRFGPHKLRATDGGAQWYTYRGYGVPERVDVAVDAPKN